MTKNWYAQKAGNDPQGMVVEEETGRTVAVAYDHEDTALLAAAPELLSALKTTQSALKTVLTALETLGEFAEDHKFIRTAWAAINKAEGELE